MAAAQGGGPRLLENARIMEKLVENIKNAISLAGEAPREQARQEIDRALQDNWAAVGGGGGGKTRGAQGGVCA